MSSKAVGLVIGLLLIMIPEPITTTVGTLLGAAIVASMFGVKVPGVA